MKSKYRKYKLALLAIITSHAFAAAPQFSLTVSPTTLIVNKPTDIIYTIQNTGADINNFYIHFDYKDKQNLVIKNGDTKTEFTATFGMPRQQPCPNSASTATTFKSQTSCTLVLNAAAPVIGNLLVPSGNKLIYTLNGSALTAPFPSFNQNIIPTALYNFGLRTGQKSYSCPAQWINV